jgi:hypothetical protein
MIRGRFYSFLMIAGFVLLVLWLTNSFSGHHLSNVFKGSPSGAAGTTTSSQTPWDYKLEEATVGDLINGDMTLLPDNRLMPNDKNYATGDKVWLLSFMSANMTTGAGGQTNVSLSAWQPIKTYSSKTEADQAMADLKAVVNTEVDLVGVYKTEYQGNSREFAVLTMPTGNQVKQPIDEERYNKLKNEKKAKVVLEVVHDYLNFDEAMAKFRGWAD